MTAVMKRTASRFVEDLKEATKANELGFAKARVSVDGNLRRDYVAMEFKANSEPPSHPAMRHRWPQFGLKTVTVHPDQLGAVRSALEKSKVTVTGAKPRATKKAPARARASRRR